MLPKKRIFAREFAKDLNIRRAAIASGLDPNACEDYLDEPEVREAIDAALGELQKRDHVDAEWLLYELVDNHILSRQMGKMAASNAALNMIAKHCKIDAYAAEKVQLTTDDAIIERLQRARHRGESFL